ELAQRRIREAMDADERVEAAVDAGMRVADVGHVERRRVAGFGKRADFAARHIEDLGGRVEKPADEPRARDAVDLRSRPRHPPRRRLPRLRRAAGGAPRLEPALEMAGFETV